MDDWRDKTLADYQQKGFAARSGYGTSPALLIVDFINGFTDPATPLGGDFTTQLDVTNRLLDAFRRGGLAVVYTTIAYEPDFRDAGLFIKKVPALGILVKGSKMVEIDARIAPGGGDYIVEKKFASAFFGTDLDNHLKAGGVDTIIMTGCTTSGCIRASAIDSLQYGYHTVVVREGVGDRAEGPHEANLFDIDAKYGDVVEEAAVLDYIGSIAPSDGLAEKASEDFRQWWRREPAA